jgi:Mrp family chromosome partitioning ATPase
MVSSIVSQLLHQTQWGELDYLIVDMPPGTGDIQISLCQELQLDGALIVTTPQRLAFIDVVKGIEMFQDLKVRILSVVENMSHY